MRRRQHAPSNHITPAARIRYHLSLKVLVVSTGMGMGRVGLEPPQRFKLDGCVTIYAFFPFVITSSAPFFTTIAPPKKFDIVTASFTKISSSSTSSIAALALKRLFGTVRGRSLRNWVQMRWNSILFGVKMIYWLLLLIAAAIPVGLRLER